MLVASTHAVPVCLFELQDGNEAQYAGASENAPSPAVVCGTDHHPALLRQLFNGGNEARTCRRSITTSVETDRYKALIKKVRLVNAIVVLTIEFEVLRTYIINSHRVGFPVATTPFC